MDDYKTLKVWEKTRRKLKIAAARRELSLTALVDELADKELDRQKREEDDPPKPKGV